MNQKNNCEHSQNNGAGLPLCECVDEALTNYFTSLDGSDPVGLYQLVLEQVEKPLLQQIMQYVGNNQCKAATVLRINRGTLRKKLKQYGLL